MNIEHLTKMANEIARFYEAYPDHAEAQREIAAHLQRFWDPRMRRQIIDHVANGQGVGLAPLALDAVRQLVPPAAA